MKIYHPLLLSIAASALACTASTSLAAPPTVEIVARSHSRVDAALKPVRQWLAQQGGRLRVIEIDAESALGERRLAAAGFSDPLPILILIDGKHQFLRKDGSSVILARLPNLPDSPSRMRGNWVAADIEAVLAGR